MNERQFQAWLADRAPATVPAGLRERVERIPSETTARPAGRFGARPRSLGQGHARRRWLALGLAAAMLTGSVIAAGVLSPRPEVKPPPTNGPIVVTNGSVAMAVDPVTGSAVPISDLGIGGRSISPIALDFAISAAWSPDGRWVAYTTPSELRMMDLASDTSERVTALGPCGSLGECGVTWSPDGQTVAFTSGDTLRSIDVATGRISLLTSGGSIGSPDWSPDGGSIVFARGHELWVIRPDGTGANRLLSEGPDRAGPIDVRWSPDSSKIGFVSSDEWASAGRRGGPGWQIQIIVVDADGSNRHAIANDGECWCMNFGPSGFAWSPDGTQIAFISPGYNHGTASKPALPDPGLHIASADGSNPRLLFRESNGHIVWRPGP